MTGAPDMARPGTGDMNNASDMTTSASDLASASDMTTSASDLANASDLGSVTGCTNGGGARAAQDPGLAQVAFCGAAWLVPGVTTAASRTTPCARMPMGNGRNAGGTACSAEDNCAPGWHVCNDENELAARGFDKGKCDAVGSFDGMWVTRQAGGPPSMGAPPVCMAGGDRAVFGCGGIGLAVGAGGCQMFTRVLADPPDPGDQCSTASAGVWLCGATMTMGDSTMVTKTGLAKGGVICCKD
jgi:hypothetical protein